MARTKQTARKSIGTPGWSSSYAAAVRGPQDQPASSSSSSYTSQMPASAFPGGTGSGSAADSSMADSTDFHADHPDQQDVDDLYAITGDLWDVADDLTAQVTHLRAENQALQVELSSVKTQFASQVGSLSSQLAAALVAQAALRSKLTSLLAAQPAAQAAAASQPCSQPADTSSTPAQPAAATQPSSSQPAAAGGTPEQPMPSAQPWRLGRQQRKKQQRQRRKQQAAARAPQPAQQQAPAAPAPHAPRMHAGVVARLVDSLTHRRQFTLTCPAGFFPAGGSTLTAQVTQLITDRMQVPSNSFTIVEATRIGRNKAFFSVSTLDQADILVRHRCKLKGSGFTLHEVLSPAECILHAKLWPQFLAARAAGRHAQFSRAQLKIDGVVVRP